MNNADEIEKLLVMVTIEKVLLEKGLSDLEKVELELNSKHNCRLYDCIECPDALKAVLCELYGDDYDEISNAINANLSSSTMDTPIENFISVLRN